jgi:hypothetical protein
MSTQNYAAFSPDDLPPVVVRYLDAQADAAQRRAVADAFADDARVVDEGIEYSGIDAIAGWLATTASEFTYTTTLIGQRSPGADRWDVLARLEGNFPGGVADLWFRFTTRDDRIVGLVIAP